MKTCIVFLSILVATRLLSVCSGYRILGVFPVNAKSHNIVFEALMKGLARRGHRVDVITHFPLQKPVKNYHEIVNLDGSMERLVNNYSMKFVKEISLVDPVENMVMLYGNRICDFMGFDEMQQLINNPPTNPPYDVVIVEAFMANCYFGLGHVLKVPVVAVCSSGAYPWLVESSGNDDNPNVVPSVFLSHGAGPTMTLWERVKNFVSNRRDTSKFHALTGDYQTKAMRKYLGPDVPDIREMEKSVALTLVNDHPVIFGVKPVLPTWVHIAGLHIEENDEHLTPELKRWLDDSVHGVVYLSFGSMVLVESLPKEQLEEIYAAFAKIAPMRVLMKVVDESVLPAGLPDNVVTMPWIPQIPLLAHKNVKVFITHCGLGGILEALYYGVPMIGVPLFADQFRNCRAFAEKETLIQINFKELSDKVLNSALERITRDHSSYKEKAVHYSKIFKDQPISPMNSAVFWIEYVIRNGQALRPPTLDYTWWQLAGLDVHLIILFAFVLSSAMIFMSVKLMVKTISKLIIRNFYGTDKVTKKSQ
ncbi:UDP-glucuronosyltransferase 1-6-like [Copidosoma floridanum]|uniref:UDP-glucuronosyltransferase 1-6-like n=1 Tax=Copidosoma floridanum TaxID=29053 RepID=UPI0006C96F4D|nr:UDP-glucuronosyltransferase 1-6-like [Copidosoma floridanum]